VKKVFYESCILHLLTFHSQRTFFAEVVCIQTFCFKHLLRRSSNTFFAETPSQKLFASKHPNILNLFASKHALVCAWPYGERRALCSFVTFLP